MCSLITKYLYIICYSYNTLAILICLVNLSLKNVLILNPKGILRNLYLPKGVLNVIISDDAASSFTFQYPCLASNFEKSVELHNFCVICSGLGMGWCSLLIASLKYLGSKQMCNQPSPFSLMARLFSHSVGPIGVLIMSCFSI